MIGRSCLCPKGWPPFILHWMKGSKLKGKSSNWWGGIQSKDKQWQLSQIVGLLKDKSSLNRLSSFWDRHSIVIVSTGSLYRGLLTRTGTGKGEGRALLSVTVRGVGGVGGSDWLERSHQTTDKKLSPYFLPHTGPQTSNTSYHAQLWVWSVQFHNICLGCIPCSWNLCIMWKLSVVPKSKWERLLQTKNWGTPDNFLLMTESQTVIGVILHPSVRRWGLVDRQVRTVQTCWLEGSCLLSPSLPLNAP